MTEVVDRQSPTNSENKDALEDFTQRDRDLYGKFFGWPLAIFAAGGRMSNIYEQALNKGKSDD